MYSLHGCLCFSCGHYWNDIVSLYPRSVRVLCCTGEYFRGHMPAGTLLPPPASALTTSYQNSAWSVWVSLEPSEYPRHNLLLWERKQLWKSLKLLFQRSNWAKNRCIMGCREFGRSLCGFHIGHNWGQTSTDWTLRVWLFAFCVLLVSHVWTSSLPEQGSEQESWSY